MVVSLSRLYEGVHYLSDVIAGSLIGFLTGMLIVKVEKEYKFTERILRRIFER